MTNLLLILLNVQLAAIVGWAILERREALAYRKLAGDRLTALEDAAIAAWARIAGKQRLQQAGNLRKPVVAGVEEEKREASQAARSETIEEALHPSIVLSRSDGA